MRVIKKWACLLFFFFLPGIRKKQPTHATVKVCMLTVPPCPLIMTSANEGGYLKAPIKSTAPKTCKGQVSKFDLIFTFGRYYTLSLPSSPFHNHFFNQWSVKRGDRIPVELASSNLSIEEEEVKIKVEDLQDSVKTLSTQQEDIIESQKDAKMQLANLSGEVNVMKKQMIQLERSNDKKRKEQESIGPHRDAKKRNIDSSFIPELKGFVQQQMTPIPQPNFEVASPLPATTRHSETPRVSSTPASEQNDSGFGGGPVSRTGSMSNHDPRFDRFLHSFLRLINDLESKT